MEKRLMKKFQEMNDDERLKVRELLKDESKRKENGDVPGAVEDAKLSWMYKGDKKNVEEYLTGKRIDDAITRELVTEEIPNNAPGAIFAEVINRRTDMDMQVKMREDPLYAIRRREEEAKRKLLENPIRMRELQKSIQEKEESKKKLKKAKSSKGKDKKKKKKSKKKKHHQETDSDDSSGSSGDDELLQKYLAILEAKKHNQLASNGDGETSRSGVRDKTDDRDAKGRRNDSAANRNDDNGHDREDGRRDLSRRQELGHDNYSNRSDGRGRRPDQRGDRSSNNGDWTTDYRNDRSDRRPDYQDRAAGNRNEYRQADQRPVRRADNGEFQRERRVVSKNTRSPRIQHHSDEDDNPDSGADHKREGSATEKLRRAALRTVHVDARREEPRGRGRGNENSRRQRRDVSGGQAGEIERRHRVREERDSSSDRKSGKPKRHGNEISRGSKSEKRTSTKGNSTKNIDGRKRRSSSSSESDGSEEIPKKKSRGDKDDSSDVVKSAEKEDGGWKEAKKTVPKRLDSSEAIDKSSGKGKQTSQDDSSDFDSSEEVEAEDEGTRIPLGYGLIINGRTAAPVKLRKSSSRSPDGRKPAVAVVEKKNSPKVKRKLTAEEMLRKRDEMMSAARERDVERESNVKRYRAEEERDRDKTEQNSELAAEFVKPLMMKHASETSVEDRIRRNKYSLQRTPAQLEKNFSKR